MELMPRELGPPLGIHLHSLHLSRKEKTLLWLGDISHCWPKAHIGFQFDADRPSQERINSDHSDRGPNQLAHPFWEAVSTKVSRLVNGRSRYAQSPLGTKLIVAVV